MSGYTPVGKFSLVFTTFLPSTFAASSFTSFFTEVSMRLTSFFTEVSTRLASFFTDVSARLAAFLADASACFASRFTTVLPCLASFLTEPGGVVGVRFCRYRQRD